MKCKFKSKCKNTNHKTLSKLINLTFVLILIFTFFFFYLFHKNIKKSLIDISNAEVNRVVYRFITDEINNDILNSDTINDILIINKNKNDEIVYIDFNLDKAYKVLDNLSDVLTSSIASLENGGIDIAYQNKDLSHKTSGIIMSIPLGSTLKSGYLYNLGPKIPVKINFIGSVLTNLETKVTDYGLNNALVEVFVYIEFHNKIISPFKVEETTLKYDAVIASKMIEGKVPSFYNGAIEKESSIYSKSIE